MADPADADVIGAVQRDAVPGQRIGSGCSCRSRFSGLDLIGTRRLADVDGARFDVGSPEASRSKLHGIIAGSRQREPVHAIGAGNLLACLACVLICGCNQNVRGHATRWIAYDSGQAGWRLSPDTGRRRENQDGGEQSEESGRRDPGWHPEIATEHRDHDSLRRIRLFRGLRHSSSIGPFWECPASIRFESHTLEKYHRIIPGPPGKEAAASEIRLSPGWHHLGWPGTRLGRGCMPSNS